MLVDEEDRHEFDRYLSWGHNGSRDRRRAPPPAWPDVARNLRVRCTGGFRAEPLRMALDPESRPRRRAPTAPTAWPACGPLFRAMLARASRSDSKSRGQTRAARRRAGAACGTRSFRTDHLVLSAGHSRARSFSLFNNRPSARVRFTGAQPARGTGTCTSIPQSDEGRCGGPGPHRGGSPERVGPRAECVLISPETGRAARAATCSAEAEARFILAAASAAPHRLRPGHSAATGLLPRGRGRGPLGRSFSVVSSPAHRERRRRCRGWRRACARESSRRRRSAAPGALKRRGAPRPDRPERGVEPSPFSDSGDARALAADGRVA